MNAAILLLIVTLTDCYVNNLDQPFDFNCPANEALVHVFSVHNNKAEDRTFTLECKALHNDGPFVDCFETAYVNGYDQPFDFACPTNHFITGMASQHNNHYEDRQFKFHCCSIQDYHLFDCAKSGWVNSYDHDEDFRVPAGKVLRGVASVHNNHNEDRIFGFEYCGMILANPEVG